jgi:hypothetical protein
MPTKSPTSPEEVLTNALDTLQSLARGKRTVFGTPIPWIAEPVFAQGFQIAPDYGAANQLILASYQVPRGYTAILCGLVLGYAGGAGAALPGQVLYTVDVDNPSAAVVSPASGYVEKDYSLVPFQLGSLAPSEPHPIEFRHDQGETVRIKGYTVSGVATGAGNFLFGALMGFQWPTMGWEG